MEKAYMRGIEKIDAANIEEYRKCQLLEIQIRNESNIFREELDNYIRVFYPDYYNILRQCLVSHNDRYKNKSIEENDNQPITSTNNDFYQENDSSNYSNKEWKKEYPIPLIKTNHKSKQNDEVVSNQQQQEDAAPKQEQQEENWILLPKHDNEDDHIYFQRIINANNLEERYQKYFNFKPKSVYFTTLINPENQITNV